ncbi:leucine-rich repeat domain-containing protein [Sphingomonas sp. AOB5]|uniref:leucine-rich repeat domain-containing protein n=1 Tax=Sphingomonas sp. AOB5 TaxID=3034017 RepID=UPI0023F8F94E|nr:leucine-rich repeat domain-containing protein [Sphingomonas sp. AOB5]MDF7775110.1 leucine-rich repeat domain-containing protein [Sphingomonas sp. AOB5]
MNAYERLTDAIGKLPGRVTKMRVALRRINDAPDFERLLDTIDEFARIHGSDPDPGLATEFATLRSDLGQYRIDPDAFEDENVRERWEALDGARGNLYLAIDAVLAAARDLNMLPEKVALTLQDSELVDRRQVGLHAINARLKAIEDMLRERIVPEGQPGEGRAIAQLIQVNNYVNVMRRNLTLFGVTLSSGDRIDLSALERVVVRMGRMTRDFHATVTSAVSRATTALRKGAGMMRRPVGKLVRGVGTIAQATLRAEGRAVAQTPPADFDIDVAREMVLRGEAPPEHWWPWIVSLDFRFSILSDLRPLTRLTALEDLNLSHSRVSDASVLSGLAALKSLNLSYTEVSDASPLSGLTALESLNLSSTRVSDALPLSGLTALESLHLSYTEVSDASPLSGLKALKSLNLSDTRVSDASPLSGLIALESLNLSDTWVSDASPLSGLTALESVILSGTKVSDALPLSELTALTNLELRRTGVSDASPLSHLTLLESLDLANTEVKDVSPLSGLNELRHLYLSRTGISDVSPLAGLITLQSLYLMNTALSDISPLGSLISLEHIDLDGTGVDDLSTLAGHSMLKRIDIVATPVTDLSPIGGLESLEEINVESEERVAELAVTFPRPGVVRRGIWLKPQEEDPDAS